jgi:hypothetical protein
MQNKTNSRRRKFILLMNEAETVASRVAGGHGSGGAKDYCYYY